MQPGASVRFAFCPPSSGSHYNVANQAPMQPAFYGPATDRAPQYWIHNLEHGYVVLAYRCPGGVAGQEGCPTQQVIDQMQSWFDTAPAPPRSECAKKVLAVRFDGMESPFALLAWDRALLLDEFDMETAMTFAQQWMETDATPETLTC